MFSEDPGFASGLIFGPFQPQRPLEGLFFYKQIHEMDEMRRLS